VQRRTAWVTRLSGIALLMVLTSLFTPPTAASHAGTVSVPSATHLPQALGWLPSLGPGPRCWAPQEADHTQGEPMTATVEENAYQVLRFLASLPRSGGLPSSSGEDVVQYTRLSPAEINDAVTILVEAGLTNWLRTFGTAPFDFGRVGITPRGRYEFERKSREEHDRRGPGPTVPRPPVPVGSPFGFTEQDWETVVKRKARVDILYVVLGYQFKSEHYKSDRLKENVRSMFRSAIDQYTKRSDAVPVSLDYGALSAGYAEHLFNKIARDIISADIAVFETSDLNPNVMLEMGVALTWDVRVLPIKRQGQPEPPSDISGQTWANYTDSAATFTDPDHSAKLIGIIDRAARKKVRSKGT